MSAVPGHGAALHTILQRLRGYVGPVPTPKEILAWSTHAQVEVRRAVAASRQLPLAVRRQLLTDPDRDVQRTAAWGWPRDARALLRMIEDGPESVAMGAAEHPAAGVAHWEAAARRPEPAIRAAVAWRPLANAQVRWALTRADEATVRFWAAGASWRTPAMARHLATLEDPLIDGVLIERGRLELRTVITLAARFAAGPDSLARANQLALAVRRLQRLRALHPRHGITAEDLLPLLTSRDAAVRVTGLRLVGLLPRRG